MSAQLASRNSRVIEGREYRYFYNPLWSCLGDRSPGPPGTYYYHSAQPVTYFWNMYDQVLLRPDLLGCLGVDGVSILAAAGQTSLLTADGLPNHGLASDHLPILFRLDL
jgi:hypothetical protein